MLPLPDLQDSCQCSIAVIVASCLTSQEQPHYRKHPDHLPPSQKAIPSPEGLTAQEVQSMQCSDLLSLLPFLSQGVDWFKLMISRFIFFSAWLLSLLGHGTTFTCRAFVCVKIRSWCLLSAVFQQVRHHALLCSRVGLPLYSPTHCTYLGEILPPHLSAGHSHYRMHIPYSTCPGVMSPIEFLILLAQFGELLILSDLEKSHRITMTNKIHTVPAAPSQDWGSPTEAFEGSEGFWQTATVQSYDKNCFTQ